MNERSLRVVGAPGSPYSRKLRAVLRFRRIPYLWIQRASREAKGLPRPRIDLLPQLIFPEAGAGLEALVDSTPLIRRLDALYPGRSVLPPDPVLAFLDALIEDYADEWLTKAMFHYRWSYPADIAKAAKLLPRWVRTDRPEGEAVAQGRSFAERQIGRLSVVGSNPITGPVIEESYRRLLLLLDAHLERSRFVLGGRPGAADFGLYGQLSQLVAFDPTPTALALELAPRVVAWVETMEDLSGLEPRDEDWGFQELMPEGLRALLAEVGRVYAPFLIANAEAVARRTPQVECEIDGRAWVQRPFPYQAKCLAWLREAHGGLARDHRRAVDALIAGTGCERLFAG